MGRSLIAFTMISKNEMQKPTFLILKKCTFQTKKSRENSNLEWHCNILERTPLN